MKEGKELSSRIRKAPWHEPYKDAPRKPDGSPDVNDRAEIGPSALAFSEWEALGLTAPNLDRMRSYRLQRVCEQLRERDYAGVLLFDPLNIRYATDSSNMHIWITHDPSRAVFVSADGYVILWDFFNCTFLNYHLPEIDEIREGGAGFFYFISGDKEKELALKFAKEVDDVIRQHGGGNRRLAVDRMEAPGLFALADLGITIESGMQVMEHARLVKNQDEINAMRCAMASCDAAMTKMHAALKPGITEIDLWSILHAENIKRGGEWIETRLLASGPRTNPWMQEAGPRVIQEGDFVGVDTDTVGPYGYLSDFSRTWLVGDVKPDDEQKETYQVAYEHIMYNAELLKPGVGFEELTELGLRLPEKYVEQRYSIMMHGVGLCDEFPAIYYPEDFIKGAFDYVVQPGMVFTSEAYVGEVGGKHGVKLENQILVTENGNELMSHYPFEERLLNT